MEGRSTLQPASFASDQLGQRPDASSSTRLARPLPALRFPSLRIPTKIS